MYLVVLLLTCGAALLLIGAFQEEYDEQEHEHPHAAWYTQMATSAMLLTLGLSAVKYVALHGITQSYWRELGSLSLLFWCEVTCNLQPETCNLMLCTLPRHSHPALTLTLTLTVIDR